MVMKIHINWKRSSTCSNESMHIVMLIALVMKWQVENLDFTSVFLLSDKLERERERDFLNHHLMCPEPQVWKLKRCIYGLNDALSSWYKLVNNKLTNLKGILHAYDNALFLWHDATGNLMGILAMYINYFCRIRNHLFQKNVIAELKKKKIQSWNTWKWNILNFGD